MRSKAAKGQLLTTKICTDQASADQFAAWARGQMFGLRLGAQKTVRTHKRTVKADGVDFPVWVVTVRGPAPVLPQPASRRGWIRDDEDGEITPDLSEHPSYAFSGFINAGEY